MSQHDLDIANQSFPAFRSDLNDALEAIATLQSGATAPATTYGGMPWIDTTEQMLKFRNVANDGWINAIKLDLVNDVVKQVGQTIAPDGSVSQPSYTFDSDGDTGIYRKGVNSMGFGAGGFERMVVKSAGVDLLGTVTAPTVSGNTDSSTNVATTAFVQAVKSKTSGVTAGTYGNATNIPQVTVDAAGRVTSASNVAVAPRLPVITAETLIWASGTFPSTFTKYSFAKSLTQNKDVGYFHVEAWSATAPTGGGTTYVQVSNVSGGSPYIEARADQSGSLGRDDATNTTKSEFYVFINLFEDPSNSNNWAIWIQAQGGGTSKYGRVALAGYM